MPENKAPDTLSFTFSDDDRVLALTRITDTGDIFTRQADHWVRVSDEDRAIFDRTMRDIAPEQAKQATAKFDEDPANLTKDDINGFLASV